MIDKNENTDFNFGADRSKDKEYRLNVSNNEKFNRSLSISLLDDKIDKQLEPEANKNKKIILSKPLNLLDDVENTPIEDNSQRVEINYLKKYNVDSRNKKIEEEDQKCNGEPSANFFKSKKEELLENKFNRRGTSNNSGKFNQPVIKKKHLEKKDLFNREKSKLACLIRKKYTTLMKESIKLKGTKEKYICCALFRKRTSKVIYQLTGTLFQTIISVIAILIYIVSTYYPDYSQVDTLQGTEKTVVNVLKWSELGTAIIINIDYIYNVYNAKQRCKYVANFLNIMDILIVFSIYLNFMVPNLRSLAFIRIFRVIRVMRVFRFLKIIESRKKDSNDENKSEINRRLVSAILTILAVVFLATGVVHFLNDSFPDYFRIIIPSLDTMACSSGNDFNLSIMEAYREGLNVTLACAEGDELVKQRGHLSFDLAFYYMVITMATVGYGDIYPDTTWMRLVIGIFVIISIITITKQTSELNDIIKLNSEYRVAFKENQREKHCVLSGFFSKTSLIKFLNEFYHIDHKESSGNTKIVIIQSDYPDKEIQSIMMNPKFEDNLHFLIGDIFSEHTLKMAAVQNAKGIFLINDQNHPDALKNDQFLILACKAISQYSQAPLYVQFNFSQSLLHDWADWDMASSSQQIKMSIIVKNGFISGFATMIMNLSSSSSSFYNSDIKETPWMLEYIHGASQEIYIVKIPEDYTKELNFTKFAKSSYMTYGSLVIGIKKKVYYQEDKDIFYFIYLLNPYNYEIGGEDEIIMISADIETARAIFYSNKKIRIKKGEDEETQSKLLNENHTNFLALFRDENEGIKQNLEQEDEEGNDVESKFDADKKSGIFGAIPDTNHLHELEIFKIADIFHKRQHFKIWENNPDEFLRELKNHFLIFCKEDHLWEFMNCFNQYHSEIIYFVSDQHPSTKWDILRRYFKNLVFIECSYSDLEDLVKLTLEKARHVYILTYAVENSNVNDSGILPLVKIIEENFPKCKYTMELSDELNVRYLNNKGVDQDGRTISETEENKNNGGVEDEKREMKKNKKVTRMPVRLWPKYAKSDIFFASSLESLLAFSYHNEGVLDVLTKILGFNNNLVRDKSVEENDSLGMFRYVGTEKVLYEKVVNNFFLLDPPIIPIAVYRMNTDPELKNELPFIITNPKKDLELNQFDKVICIGKAKDNIFQVFNREDFSDNDDSYLSNDSSDHDNSLNEKSEKTKTVKVNPKNMKNNEDLDNLDEEQLLEKLKDEIRNLKMLAKSNNSDFARKSTLKKNSLNHPFNIIEEKNEDLEDNIILNKSGKNVENISKSKFKPIKTDFFKNEGISFINKIEPPIKIEDVLSTSKEEINISNKEEKELENIVSDSSNDIDNNTSDKKKKKSKANKIINNNNYSIKISANNQFQGTNTINISQPKAFSKLSIASVEGFIIANK